MNIALFGGSFNPIHLGHKKLINEIKNKINIDKFILMPTAVSPHKSNAEMEKDIHRFNMCKLAFENEDNIEVSKLEIERKVTSYTYLTIDDLKEKYPNDNIFLIIGADMLMSFSTWKNYRYILDNVILIAVPRDTVSFDVMKKYADELDAKYHILSHSVMDVSSSEIRDNIKSGKCVSNLLDEKVLNYIKENKLYGI